MHAFIVFVCINEVVALC